ncbi:unnamed protein product [Notodromas monacha]|uniref:Uncharacterized protein n=1 Tax=Notodromas monacha TaxID=399045 RepID=A0A7R9BK65_9CRUS|nr:unnamed protein product [Notodromas monacha]CAG0915621.1 unnamed protein product [Notodromas monacha]
MIDTDESDFDEDVFGLSDGDEEEEDKFVPPEPEEKKAPSKNILKFRKALGLDDAKAKGEEALPVVNRIETIASRMKRDLPPPEVVIFSEKRHTVDSASRRRKRKDETNIEEKTDVSSDLRKMKNDVYRFGIKGFEKSKQESAMEDLLCSLGARKKRDECINYKILKEQRRKEKEAALRAKAEGSHYSSALVLRVVGKSKKKLSKAQKKDRNKVSGFDVQPGKYRGGVQYIRPAELKKLK